MTTAAATQYLAPFGGSAKPVERPDKLTLGGKGFGLQVMSSLVDVPPGFTLATNLCVVYQESDDLPTALWTQIREEVHRIERDTGKIFGGDENPLLVSCRSGAAISMPGMMDTVLNIGLNSQTVEALAKATKNPRFAYDAYRRLLDMFGDVVLGMPHESFEKEMSRLKNKYNVKQDVDFSADQLKELCLCYKEIYVSEGKKFPEEVYDQLTACVKAVFGSWNSERAIKYREIKGITNLVGTACNIQTMVFGNFSTNSGTGVAFSRNPATGEPKMMGEYLVNAQGEDVVAGIRTPKPIATMKEALPAAYEQFVKNMDLLERHFEDMQDVEFTVENGKLWMLQCRSGKRTGQAAFRIACDLVKEGITSKEDALLKIDPDHVRQILHPTFSADVVASELYQSNIVAKGLAGGPGAAVGKLVFKTNEAEARSNEKIILVREVTSPEDVGGMWASQGVLTARGGITSHAAVVARGWGKPCVCGCEDLQIDEELKTMTIKSSGRVFKENDVISINGNTGEVLSVAIPTSQLSTKGPFGEVLGWTNTVEDAMKVLANSDSGPDSTKSVEFGAHGIGLTRTEHMFFAHERLPVVRKWILKGEGLEALKSFQRQDFVEIFRAMEKKPVTVRMLDPPLHEFLPPLNTVNKEMADELGFENEHDLVAQIQDLHEENPMLGLRGCRLGIVHPDLTEMQVEAIMHAAIDVTQEGLVAFPRLMIPLVGNLGEFENQALEIKEVAKRVLKERGVDIRFEIGTMIEVPRAALISDQIAKLVDPSDGQPLCQFFSYGTNDLTQMTMGISRDDAGEFIKPYLDLGILENDPFKTIDSEGVGYLVKMSAAKARNVNPNISLSVCGEHGGDPASIAFFDEVGLDYVSCSPFRICVARLASAQAAIQRRKNGGKPRKEEVVSFVPTV